MLATSCYELDGFKILAYRGVVCGSAVRTPTIAESFWGRIKYLIGGRITSFANMSENAHQEAYRDMLIRAKTKGANAVIRTRFETNMIVPKLSASEVICYGTAVIVEKATAENGVNGKSAVDRNETKKGSVPEKIVSLAANS